MITRNLMLAGLVVVVGCSDNDSRTPSPADAGITDDAGSDAGGDADAAVPAEFGLDERPANPTCVAQARPTTGEISVQFEPRFGDLSFSRPVGMYPEPGSTDRYYVLEKRGTIQLVTAQGQTFVEETFFDLRDQVESVPPEAGLLGMAFHPNFAQNRFVYLSYTQKAPTVPSGLQSVVYRYRLDPQTLRLDPASRTLIFGPLDQPSVNHNGGHIVFGPDGYLYLGMGDGGPFSDPEGRGQDTNVLFGKILRLDVDGGSPYAIPPTNPFANGGGMPEIYALGFRNPWRFSFDRLTGEMWAGDVGEDTYEEVNRVELGGNYGWSIREGAHCFEAQTCDTTGLIDPVAEYTHAEGVAVTGGYVYRGSASPELQGTYIYGDHGTGRIWGLPIDGGEPQVLNPNGPNYEVTSFVEEPDGELDIVDYGTGRIFRLRFVTGSSGGSFPQLLSETGCFNPQNPTQPAAGVISYELNMPLWSDGAGKDRFMAIPDGTTIHINDDGDWEFPVGTVLIKTFALQNRMLETRLFMRHEDGAWGGYSYEWNEEQTDARLLTGSKAIQVGDQPWYYPSREECFRCHTSAAGGSLGPETAQLNRDMVYSTGRLSNQLATLDHIGMFDAPLPGAPSTLEAFPTLLDETQPLENRARAYLHSNCSGCHRPGAPGQGPMDFRHYVSLKDMKACDVLPTAGDLGVADARIVAPGEPARSLVSVRMHALGVGRMPPLATSVVDHEGTTVMDAWITSLTGCP